MTIKTTKITKIQRENRLNTAIKSNIKTSNNKTIFFNICRYFSIFNKIFRNSGVVADKSIF